jgi:FkbM family methyltransferase
MDKMNPLDINTLENLKSYPRYTPGQIRLNGLSIRYNDSLALYNGYKDIFINRIYEFKPVHPCPVILDVGGYIGLSTMYFKTSFPGADVTVFEPDPGIFHILELNLEANHFTGVQTIRAGAGKKEGNEFFFPDGADGGNRFVSKHDTSMQVNIVKLSNYINSPIDLLKMNIEGMEGEVFEEIESRLSFIREIIFEYHAFHNLPQSLGKILDILDRNGFRFLVTDIPGAVTPVPFNMNGNYKRFNLVYARRNGE